MRLRVILAVFLSVGLWTIPVPGAQAAPTLQQQYLDIYLKINDAEHLERQGDFRGALDDFKDCYQKLAHIHETDPDWEKALVTHRMDDCRTKILDLEPKAAAQPDTTPPPPMAVTPAPPAATPDTTNTAAPAPTTTTTSAAPSDEVASLKQQLAQVQTALRAESDELTKTKESLRDSQAQLEAYRSQVETLNAQLAAVKSQQPMDNRMGDLLSQNKELTDKLAAAQKEIDMYKASPKSKLALVEAQLKNMQDQYAATQEANKALLDTTTALKQQLDAAQADLVTANQKLAAASTSSPEYQTLKRENEMMRDILTRELQEQAHRDMAKRLAQEEFDNLKLKSKVLQENLDILATPMTPPNSDQEREFLASLRTSSPDVSAPPAGNSFSAPVSGTVTDASSTTTPAASPAADTNMASSTPAAPATTAPATMPDTNVAVAPAAPASTNPVAANPPSAPPTVSSPATNMASSTPTDDKSGVTVVNANTPADTTPTNTVAATPPAPDATNPPMSAAPSTTPDGTSPIPPSTPVGAPPATVAARDATSAPAHSSDTTPATPPASDAPTTTTLPPAQTVYQDTTIQNNAAPSSQQPDPTQYSHNARLPDDMRETAQQAADYFKNQRYDDAAADYQSIIDKYPGSLYAWSNLGVVRFQQGKLEDALKALQQAVKLSPTDAFSYSNLGIVYYQLGQYENAIDALNSAKALDPNDAKTHNYLGCACSQKGWQEVAEKEFRKAIEIDNSFGDAHFNLALVYATSKPPSLELARREYNRALELGIAKDARLEKLLGNSTASTP